MKYLALDIGNVLCHVNFDTFLNKLSSVLNITLEDAQYFLNRTQKLHDLGYTIMKDELRDHFKIKSQILIQDLLTAWNDSIKIGFPMIHFIQNLYNKGNLKIALLSNIGLEHAELIEKLIGEGTFYTHTIKHFSCFVGARKPNLLYYQSFLMQNPEFKNCLYIDDLQENLDASKQFGFQTYRFSLIERAQSYDNYHEYFNNIEYLLK